MHLRHNSERRAPLIYEGDGTYSNPRLALDFHSPPSNNADDEATVILSRLAARRRARENNLATVDKRALSSLTTLVPALQSAIEPLPASLHPSDSTTQRKRGMANIKFVRPRGIDSSTREVPKKRQSRAERMPTVDSLVSTTSVERPARRKIKNEVVIEVVMSKPAAFPSARSGGPDRGDSVGKHGISRLMKERHGGDINKRMASFKRIDAIYNNRSFPGNMTAIERQWYIDLKNRIGATGGNIKISFRSLWWSLRQTIIDEIRDEGSNTYASDYVPVLSLLRLEKDSLMSIINENIQVWYNQDDIPEYLRQLKREHPEEPVDPDTPPPHEVMKAINYLKQEHLPGSLLGEWQFPLPETGSLIEPLSPARSTSTTADFTLEGRNASIVAHGTPKSISGRTRKLSHTLTHSPKSSKVAEESVITASPQWKLFTTAPEREFQRPPASLNDTKPEQYDIEETALDQGQELSAGFLPHGLFLDQEQELEHYEGALKHHNLDRTVHCVQPNALVRDPRARASDMDPKDEPHYPRTESQYQTPGRLSNPALGIFQAPPLQPGVLQEYEDLRAQRIFTRQREENPIQGHPQQERVKLIPGGVFADRSWISAAILESSAEQATGPDKGNLPFHLQPPIQPPVVPDSSIMQRRYLQSIQSSAPMIAQQQELSRSHWSKDPSSESQPRGTSESQGPGFDGKNFGTISTNRKTTGRLDNRGITTSIGDLIVGKEQASSISNCNRTMSPVHGVQSSSTLWPLPRPPQQYSQARSTPCQMKQSHTQTAQSSPPVANWTDKSKLDSMLRPRTPLQTAMVDHSIISPQPDLPHVQHCDRQMYIQSPSQQPALATLHEQQQLSVGMPPERMLQYAPQHWLPASPSTPPQLDAPIQLKDFKVQSIHSPPISSVLKHDAPLAKQLARSQQQHPPGPHKKALFQQTKSPQNFHSTSQPQSQPANTTPRADALEYAAQRTERVYGQLSPHQRLPHGESHLPPQFPHQRPTSQLGPMHVNFPNVVHSNSPQSTHFHDPSAPLAAAYSPGSGYGDPCAIAHLSNNRGPYFLNHGYQLNCSPHLPHQSPYVVYPSTSPPRKQQYHQRQHQLQQSSAQQLSNGQHSAMDPRLMEVSWSSHPQAPNQNFTQPTSKGVGDQDWVMPIINVSSVREVNDLMPRTERKRGAPQPADGLDFIEVEDGKRQRV